MADVAISGLTALGAAPATTDLLVLVDVSDPTQAPTGTTKKMTVANLFASPTVTGQLTLTGGTVTASTPVVTAAQTWNNAAVTFTGLKLNVTDSASAAASLLADLQVASTSKWAVDKSGAVTQSGDLAINTNKFTVAAATGNTSIAGTLGVTGQITGNLTGAVTGNASTATALATSRTLWGQSFDGTANVSGALSSVSTISMTGTLTMTAAASKIVPGATSFSHRNNADTADNLLITDAGAVTVRAGVSATTGTFSASGASVTLGGSAAASTYLLVNASASTASATVQFAAAGANKWAIGRGASAGSNHFEIYNNGTASSPLTIDVTTNRTTIGSGLTVSAETTVLAASATSGASLRVTAGTAPTSPVDGDLWYDGTNLKFRVGGTTKTVTLT